MGRPTGCPGGLATGTGGFTYGDYGKVFAGPEVHSDGEIWVQTLWDLRDEIGSETAEGIVTEAMRLSPVQPLVPRDAERDPAGRPDEQRRANEDTIWAVFAHRGMGFFAGAFNGDDAQPVENFALPPAGSPTGSLAGSITDFDTAEPIEGAIVAFGGHTNGAGRLRRHDRRGRRLLIGSIFVGTYPKVSARAPGYDAVELATFAISGATARDFQLRRDWAARAAAARSPSSTVPTTRPSAAGRSARSTSPAARAGAATPITTRS